MFSSYFILGGDVKEPGDPPDQRMEAVEVGNLQAGSGKTTVGSSPTYLASLADTVVERNGEMRSLNRMRLDSSQLLCLSWANATAASQLVVY